MNKSKIVAYHDRVVILEDGRAYRLNGNDAWVRIQDVPVDRFEKVEFNETNQNKVSR
jgi:hypothetical protein